jgi:beta-mannanase
MRFFRIIIVLLLLPFAVSCSGQLFAGTATPQPTPTTVPTITPTPTPVPAYAAISKIYFGAFAVGTEMQKALGHKLSGQLYYHAWGAPFGPQTFTTNAKNGQITMPTWEFVPSFEVDDPNILHPLGAILEGEYDKYIRQFARDAAEFKRPLLLRWGHEMNGDWYAWSGKRNGGPATDQFGDSQKADGPERFVAAYRYLHKLFDEEKATNVLWVWCPNVAMTGPLGEPWNAIANYYPGDEYVDWLCMDGYNWGTSQNWSHWQTFDSVYQPTYRQLQALNASKPMMIGEFASSEKGGDKAAWIADMFKRIPSAYPQIRMVFWFNLNKETDWRMNSSEASLQAVRQGFADPIWNADPWPGLLP